MSTNNILIHYGVLGMKWGVRRYQNLDGSLTKEGLERYKTSNNRSKQMEDVKKIISNLNEKDKDYIGNGEWVDSDSVIYRNIKYIDKKPAAFIDVYDMKKYYDKKGVVAVAVDPEYRRRGIAKELVDGMLENFKNDSSIDGLIWMVDEDNIWSINLASSFGFKENYDIEKDENTILFYYDLKRK